MSFLGQQLAAIWIKRLQDKGYAVPMRDRALAYKYMIYGSVGFWLFAIFFVLATGLDRASFGRHAAGQWIWVFMAAFGWIAPIILLVRRKRLIEMREAVRQNNSSSKP